MYEVYVSVFQVCLKIDWNRLKKTGQNRLVTVKGLTHGGAEYPLEKPFEHLLPAGASSI